MQKSSGSLTLQFFIVNFKGIIEKNSKNKLNYEAKNSVVNNCQRNVQRCSKYDVFDHSFMCLCNI